MKREGEGVTRLSFLKVSAGAAAGAAAIGVPVAAAIEQHQQPGVVTEPSGPNPSEPVMAYVRDADRGEVTILHGTGETTYRDKALVKRLMAAAPQNPTANGGGLDVIAP